MSVAEGWLESIITTGDGRPLHTHRLSDAQLSSLEAEIRHLVSRRQHGAAAAAFVLWASERYRRDYDGGVLSWGFLTEGLGIDISQEDLREMTRLGLGRLKRPVQQADSGGIQYLRSIAAEGGIPVRILSGQGGYRTALLGLVADLARLGLGCPREIALGFSARRTLRLPLGYRTAEFRSLFVDFAMEVLELRSIAPDNLGPHEVEAWLDRVKPDWREGLTLRIDGDAARSLLSEALAITRRSGLVADPLCRILQRGDGNFWTELIDVEEAAEIAAELLNGVEHQRTRIRLAPVGPLAAAVPDLLLALDRDAPGEPWTCRRISARRTARFRYPLDQGADLVAMADGRFLERLRLPGGDAIDLDAGPSFWRVAEMGERSAAVLEFAGRASLRTQDPYVWILTARDMAPDCTDGIQCEADGETGHGRLWKLSGSGRVSVCGGNAAVQTGAEVDDREEIVTVGPLEYRVLDARGAPVYRGMPQILHRHAGRGFRQLSARDVRHRVGRQGIWRAGFPQGGVIGRVEVAAKEGQGVGARVAMHVVPSSFSVREGLVDQRGDRTVCFEGLPDGWILKVGESAPIATGVAGSVDVVLHDALRTHGRLPLLLSEIDGSSRLSWKLDLPRERGEFQDLDGLILSDNRDITMIDLRDWRIVPADNRTCELRIRLQGNHTSVSPVIGQPIATEQPLSAYRTLFEEMLDVGGPEAELRLRVVTDGVPSPRLVLRRSLGETRLDGAQVCPSDGAAVDGHPDLEVVAVDMDDPGRERVANPQDLEGLGEGRWFLLPRLHGRPLRPPRPFIRPVPADISGANALTRRERIAHYVAGYQSEDDTVDPLRLARLAGVLIAHGASPSALDQVLALQEVPDVAVRLLLRVQASDLEDMLTLELNGGPRWMLIPPKIWETAISAEADRLHSTFANIPAIANKAQDLVRDAISARATEILRLRPALFGHVALALFAKDPRLVMSVGSRLGGLPAGFQSPEVALLEHAQRVAKRNASEAPRLHDLVAMRSPKDFAKFNPHLRGLIEAPLFVSEVAFGRRPSPIARQKVELVQAIHADPGAFEAALPAAMAWQHAQNQEKR